MHSIVNLNLNLSPGGHWDITAEKMANKATIPQKPFISIFYCFVTPQLNRRNKNKKIK